MSSDDDDLSPPQRAPRSKPPTPVTPDRSESEPDAAEDEEIRLITVIRVQEFSGLGCLLLTKASHASVM
jgi:hypothetical protein